MAGHLVVHCIVAQDVPKMVGHLLTWLGPTRPAVDTPLNMANVLAVKMDSLLARSSS